MAKQISPAGPDSGDSLDRVLRNNLFGEDSPFHQDYRGDEEDYLAESRMLQKSTFSVWDLLVPEDERERIGLLDPIIREKCQYLERPNDPETELFYFCTAFDRPRIEDKRVRANLMESHCLGDYTICSRYKAKINDESKK